MTRGTTHTGMTLIELLAVIAIIIIVLALALPNFASMIRAHRWTAAGGALQSALLRCQTHAMTGRRDHAIEICPHPDNDLQYFRIETESALLESIPELNAYFTTYCNYYYMRLPQDWIRAFRNAGGIVHNPAEQPWPPEWEVTSPNTSFEYHGPKLDVDTASSDDPGSPATQDNLKVDDHIFLPHGIRVDMTASKRLVNYDKPPQHIDDVPQYGWDETPDLRFNIVGIMVQAQNPEIVLVDRRGEHMRLQILRSTARIRNLSGLD